MAFLGVDTATASGSIALARAGRVLAAEPLAQGAWHARELLDRVERLLAGAGMAAGDLAGIGVAVGPGSFTGVRVGMASMKGIAFGLGIPLCGLSTLAALALAALAQESGVAALCPVLQAGRGELYAALFGAAGGGLVRRSPDRSRRPAELIADLEEGTALVGDGAAIALEAAGAIRRLRLIEPCPRLAGAIALHAAGALRPGGGYAIGSLEPNYVRPSDAEAARPRS